MKITVACTSEIKPDFVSRLIMWWQGTNYSHIFFMHQGYIYHADGRGVNKVSIQEYLKTHKIQKSFEVNLDMTEGEFEAFMEGEKEKDYSESQYLGFIFPFLRRFVDNNNTKRICSELVAVVLKKYGQFKFRQDEDFMSPLDVVFLIEKQAVNKILWRDA